MNNKYEKALVTMVLLSKLKKSDKEKAIKGINRIFENPEEQTNKNPLSIFNLCHWSITPEGGDFWSNVDVKLADALGRIKVLNWRAGVTPLALNLGCKSIEWNKFDQLRRKVAKGKAFSAFELTCPINVDFIPEKKQLVIWRTGYQGTLKLDVLDRIQAKREKMLSEIQKMK